MANSGILNPGKLFLKASLFLTAFFSLILITNAQTVVTNETFPNTFNSSFSSNNQSNGTFTGSSGTWTGSSNANAAVAVIPAYYSPVTNAIKIVNWNTSGKGAGDCHAASPTVNLSGYTCSPNLNLSFDLYTYACNASDNNSTLVIEYSSDGGSSWTPVWTKTSAQIYNTYGGTNQLESITIDISNAYRVNNFKYRFSGYMPGNNPTNFYVFIDNAKITAAACTSSCLVGGVNLGNLTNYLFVFTDGSTDANWQSASKGFIGNVAIDGIQASERTSGTFAYAGTIFSNDASLSAWQGIVTANSGQAYSSLNQSSLISGLESDLNSVFTQINAKPVTAGYNGIAATALDGLNTQNGIAETFVININSGFSVSSKINITGDANDIFILRWDTDMNFGNGYQGQVKFQSGGAIVPLGGLKPSNFIHVAGDINASGGGSNPAAPYPQGPRTNNGTGSLISGGSDFSGGGFFTGYWFTKGDPANGETASLSNAIFVGGWYSTTKKFSMTSGTSGVYVAPVCGTTPTGCTAKVTNLYFNKLDGGTDLPITNGSTFTVAQLGSLYNLEAGTTGTVGSVKFTITGPAPTTNIENSTPYNAPGGNTPWTGTVGTYNVNMKTYSSSNAGGTLCHDTTISFTLTNTITCNPDDGTANNGTSFCAPTPVCASGNFSWSQSINNSNGSPSVVRLISGSTTSYIIPGTYPTALSGPVTVTVTEVISYDGYAGRSSVTQTNERWRIVFKKNGATVATTPYTTDVPDLKNQAYWKGALGTAINLPNGTDQIVLEHYDVANGSNGPGSVVPVSICINYTTTPPAGLTLGNKVFFDNNRSGMFDAGDGFVSGATVRLYRDANNDNVPDGAFIQATVTNALGEYSFTNLAAGNYIVGVVVPPTYAITVLNGGDPDNNIDDDNNAMVLVSGEARGNAITLAAGTEPTGGNTNNTYDFGFYNPITPPNGGESCFTGTNPIVYAKSYWNVNQNSQTVTIRVTFSKAFVDNCYKSSGSPDNWNRGHSFGDLTGSDHLLWSLKNGTGSEVLRFKQDYITANGSGYNYPSGYGTLGFSGDGSNPSPGATTDVLSFRTSLTTNFNDFGYVLTSDSPPTDANYTPNAAAPNWIYDVWYEVTVKASVFGASGFGFVDVASVHASPSKTGNNTETITNLPCAGGSIGDRVWNDVNRNGVQDPTEVGLAGVMVTLYDNAGVPIASTLTDAYGNYKFNNLETSVAGVNYQVRFSLLPGYQFSTNTGAVTVINNSDANITTGRTTNITLTNTVPNVSYVDAGMYYTIPARIGDFVWNDLNNNGIQEAGEPGIAGVTVMLYTSANDLYRSTVTSNNGYYFFDDVAPGTYYVKVAPPVGYKASPKDIGSDLLDSDIDPVTFKTANFVVTNGTNDLTIDAGLNVTPATGASASLGDKVWEDLNNNNLQDAGEPGIANVTVQLYNSANTLIATTTTDAFGNYIFNGLTPGSYYVKFALPTGFGYVTQDVGANDNIDSDVNPATNNSQTVTLVADEVNTSVDAGMRRTTAGASLGDYVWYDLNKNGIQDGGAEAGVPGITVVLYNSSNAVVKTTTTDINGFYLFTGLTPATTYTVGFENIPSGYGFSPKNGAITSATNSDVNPSTGRTGTVTTGAAGTTISYVDAGLIITPNSFDSKSSIGDKLFNDLNNNGIQDAGEPGIAGVTVTLYAGDGTTVIATTTTDAAGNYLFTNLNAGTYVVGFTGLPTGYVFATKDAGTDDTKDSDVNTGTGKTDPFSIGAGEINLTIDAGARNTNANLSSIGDFVWYDLNSNGIQDAGEPGAAGVSVRLINMAGNTVGNTTTNASGKYLFTDLVAGNYFVEFSNLPTGYTATTKNATGSTSANNSDANIATTKTDIIVLPASTTDLNWDLGLVTTTRASLGDFVWNDINGNGRQDAGEPGVAGVTVTLYDNNNNPVASTVTDANGFYFFSNILPGTYSVGFSTIPASSSFTVQNAGGATAATNSDPDPATGRTATFTLTGGQSKTDIDAGLVARFAAVGNYVWYDVNSNGIQDANEPGIAGVTVILYNNANVPVASAVTDANGYYFINNIPVTAAGTSYTIGFGDIPSGMLFTTKNAGGSTADNNSDADAGTGKTDPFTLVPGQIRLDIDAGLRFVFGSIADFVWNDVNRNGTQDAGELGLAGVTVSLYDNSNNLIASTVTDAYGQYKFSGLTVSPAGTNYQVRFSLVPGYQFSPNNGAVTVETNSDANVTTGRTGNITLTSTTPDVTYVDAGMYYTIPARLGDFVWNDLNNNGIQEAGEPGIAGVTVMLYTSANVLYQSTITSSNGNYFFNDVAPGSYYVKVTPPLGYQVSPKDAGGNDDTDSDIDPVTFKTGLYTVVNGTNDLSIDAGLNVTTTATASLGDRVWEDLNNNNLQDAGEPGIANVTVQLYNSANTLIATVTTDAFGNYIFNGLAPGDYYVKFTTPAGFNLVTADAGADDIDSDVNGANGAGTTATVTLIADQINTTVDAGYRRTTAGASLGDYVWYDLNKDGIQDGGAEVGVPGVTVLLYNPSNVVVQTTTTDGNGFYLFTGLPAGTTYTVGITNIPAGYGFSPNNGLVTDPTNSDVNPLTGRTGNVTTGAAGSVVSYVDAGLIVLPNTFPSKSTIGDRVWNDFNNNGIQDAGEPGIAGVTVTLYAANGTTVIATTTTDALGNYLFTNLDAGSYVVGFSNLPAGYVFAIQDAGTNDELDSDADPVTGKTAPITVIAGEINLSIDAGARNNTPLSSIGNFVWYDVNGNGIQNAGEPGAAGISVALLNASGTVLNTTTTNAQGEYWFTDLVPGTYYVQFGNLPAGFAATAKNAAGSTAANGSDANTTTLRTDAIVLAANTADPDWDMGIISTTRASVGDFVWNDLNGNGIQDAGEPGVAGITVTLYDNTNTAVASTITDANGFYLFSNVLPGDYSIGFSNIPASSTFTLQNAGGAGVDSDPDPATGRTATFTLVAGQSKTDIDAGLVSYKAAVGDYVWFDLNKNGKQDAGEAGVAGVTVTMYTSTNATIGDGDDVAVASAVTDANGYYFINNVTVAPIGSQFYMRYTDVPTTYTSFTLPLVGGTSAVDNSKVTAQTLTNGRTGFFTLSPNQVYRDIDAGLIKQINLSGNVWHDVNGLLDFEVNNSGGGTAAPLPIPLFVYLVNASTGLIEKVTIVSGVDGTYNFANISPNTLYYVYLSSFGANIGDPPPAPALPTGWIHTGQNLGAGVGNDFIPGDGRLTIPPTTSDVINANFGIQTAGDDVIIG